MNRIEVITSVERRRRWSAAEKARLVALLDEPGAVVSDIAREAGVDASLLYRWRRQLASATAAPPLEGPTFVPVHVTGDVEEGASPKSALVYTPTTTPAPASIMIAIGPQVRVTVEGAPDAAANWKRFSRPSQTRMRPGR